MEIKKIIQKLNEAIDPLNPRTLKEDYDSRVKQVADAMNRSYPNGVSNDEFPRLLMSVAGGMNILELKPVSGGSGTTRKEFLKDVRKLVSKTKNTASADRAQEKAQKLERISHYIEDAIGNTFPDGDPFDHLMPKLRKLGLNDNNMMEWLDAATKKHLGMKSYYAYLAAVWDDFARDSGDMLGISPENNPWR